MNTFAIKLPINFPALVKKSIEHVLAGSLIRKWRRGNRTARALLLRFFHGGIHKFICTMTKMDDSTGVTICQLSPPTQTLFVAPRHFLDNVVRFEYGQFDAMFSRRIEDALVHARASVVQKGGALYFQSGAAKLFDRILYRNGFVHYHEAIYAACVVKHVTNIERGIFLSGDGASNWYHWLIEILPKAMFLKRLPDQYSAYPLLVPREVETIATFRESLGPI